MTSTQCATQKMTQVELAPLPDKKGKQIGIMGGTFNPVHIAHLVGAQQALTKLRLDEIWFIPDNIPPHKHMDQWVSAEDRVEMLRLATQDNPRFKVKLLELQRGGVSYTIDTMHYLLRHAPQNHYYLIMGGDQVNSFPTWKNADELAKLATLVGIRRPGYPQNPQYPMIWVDAPDIRLSSTAIRLNVATGNSIRYLVPESVRQFIKEKGLYRG